MPVGRADAVQAPRGRRHSQLLGAESQRQAGSHSRLREHALVQADTAGVYRGQCAEFCGLQHAKMALLHRRGAAGEVRGLARRRRRRHHEPPTDSTLLYGQRVFMSSGCAVCHSDRRHGGARDRRSRTSRTSRAASTIAAGTLANTRANLTRWIEIRGDQAGRAHAGAAAHARASSTRSSPIWRRSSDAGAADRREPARGRHARRCGARDETAALDATWRDARGSGAGSRPSTTSRSASATSSRRF